MKRFKRSIVILIALGMIVSLAMIIPASAQTSREGRVKVEDDEFIFAEMDYTGEITGIQVFDWLSLSGDGTVEVRERQSIEGDTSWQGVKGSTKPKTEDGYIVWPELSVDGNSNVIANTKFSENMVEEAKMKIPLDVTFRFYFDGAPVADLETITGKSGRFKMEVTFKNESAELTEVEYEDPATGEMVTEMVETYLPMVILPYDWYFDNSIFFNLEADPTGVVVWMPDFYNVGWSIPLFPPATGESHTISVAADVKDFQLPPLTLAVAFEFPQTNQADPLELIGPGMELIYGGLLTVGEGVGTPDTADTLLYGITQIDSGLKQMADAAEGVPYAKANIDNAMIPGVQQAAAGIGSETTPDTLLYADAAAMGGLEIMATGIGSPTTDPSLLYGMAQMDVGLRDIQSGIGSETTDPSLLYGIAQMEGGLNEIKNNIGSTGDMNTLLWGVAQVVGGIDKLLLAIGNPAGPAAGTILFGLNSMISGVNLMIAGINTQLLPGIASIRTGVSSGSYVSPGILEGLTNPTMVPQPGVLEGLTMIQQAAAPAALGGILDTLILQPFLTTIANLTAKLPPGDPDVANLVTYQSGLWNFIVNPANPLSAYTGATTMIAGVNQMITGITQVDPVPPYVNAGLLQGLQLLQWGVDNSTAPPGSPPGLLQGLTTGSYVNPGILEGLTLIRQGIVNVDPNPPYTNAGMIQGLQMMRQGLTTGSYTNPGIKEGMELISQGIGEPTIDGTLLYGATAIQGGLLQIAAGIGSETTGDTLLFAVDQIEKGLNDMLAGIGGQAIPDTLLYALAQMQMGLHQLKAGMSTGDPNNPGLLEGLVLLSAGLGDIITGLGSAENPDTLLYGTNAIASGLTELGDGVGQLTDGALTFLETFSLTAAELEAIAMRGEEFDHLLGRAEDADNNVRFVYQMTPTYNYGTGSSTSWIVAIVLSVIIALLLVAGGIILARGKGTA